DRVTEFARFDANDYLARKAVEIVRRRLCVSFEAQQAAQLFEIIWNWTHTTSDNQISTLATVGVRRRGGTSPYRYCNPLFSQFPRAIDPEHHATSLPIYEVQTASAWRRSTFLEVRRD